MPGGVLSNLFGSNKAPQPVKYPEIEKLANLNIGEVSKNLGLNNADLGQYSTDVAANRGAVTDLTNRFTNLARGIQGRNNDPFQNYTQIGNYLSGLINDHAVNPVINNLVNQTRIRNAVTGINPGVDSTTDRLQRAGIASKVRLSALQDVINNLTPAANALFNQRQQADAFALGLAPQELALRNQAAANALLPLYARNQNMADQLAQAQAAANLFKSSVYGFKQPQNFWDKAGNALDAVWDKAMDAASVYASLYGGGGGGMGRRSQPAQPTFQPVQQGQISNPNFDASYARYLPQYESMPAGDPYNLGFAY